MVIDDDDDDDDDDDHDDDDDGAKGLWSAYSFPIQLGMTTLISAEWHIGTTVHAMTCRNQRGTCSKALTIWIELSIMEIHGERVHFLKEYSMVSHTQGSWPSCVIAARHGPLQQVSIEAEDGCIGARLLHGGGSFISQGSGYATEETPPTGS